MHLHNPKLSVGKKKPNFSPFSLIYSGIPFRDILTASEAQLQVHTLTLTQGQGK